MYILILKKILTGQKKERHFNIHHFCPFGIIGILLIIKIKIMRFMLVKYKLSEAITITEKNIYKQGK